MKIIKIVVDKLPENCLACFINDCEVDGYFSKKRPPECPLVTEEEEKVHEDKSR